MLHYLQNNELFNKPILLAKDAISLEVIASVFSDYSLQELRIMIWQLLQVALVTDNDNFREQFDRDCVWHQCGRLEELIEAAYLICEGS
jgi:hypothetical protein